MKLKNTSLKNDFKGLLKELKNISEIKKGTISGFSIEIQTIEPISIASYVYYDNQKDRDLDFDLLNKLISNGD